MGSKIVAEPDIFRPVCGLSGFAKSLDGTAYDLMLPQHLRQLAFESLRQRQYLAHFGGGIADRQRGEQTKWGRRDFLLPAEVGQ